MMDLIKYSINSIVDHLSNFDTVEMLLIVSAYFLLSFGFIALSIVTFGVFPLVLIMAFVIKYNSHKIKSFINNW